MPITVLEAEDANLNTGNKAPYLMKLIFWCRKQISIPPTKAYTAMYWGESNAVRKVKQVAAIRNRQSKGDFLN